MFTPQYLDVPDLSSSKQRGCNELGLKQCVEKESRDHCEIRGKNNEFDRWCRDECSSTINWCLEVHEKSNCQCKSKGGLGSGKGSKIVVISTFQAIKLHTNSHFRLCF